MMSLVDNILVRPVTNSQDYSQIQAGKFCRNIDSLKVLDKVNDCIGLIRFQCSKKGVNLQLKVKDDIPMTIYNDERRLKQILLSLLSNANKFTNSGSIVVTVKRNTEDHLVREIYPNSIKVSVKDSGIGIKPEDLSKLFQIFGRVQNSRLINTHGVGLGLTISKKIVE